MKTIISKRLANLMPVYEEVKLNNILYRAGIKFNSLMLLDETDKDYTVNIEAKEFNFFCYNKNNKITCWPVSKGDQPLNDAGQWKKEGRQEIKPGKYLLLFTDFARFFDEDGGKITPDDETRDKIIRRLCEIFTDKIKGSNEEIIFNFSSNISEIYDTEEVDDSGYLRNSCMRPSSNYGCRQYAGFYDLIPGLQVLYKKMNDKLLFRALFWDAETEDGTKVKFLDRIYSNESTANKLIEVAKEKGWAWRSFSNSVIYLNDERVNLHCEITETAFNYLENEGSPYVDSLNRLSTYGKYILSNHGREDYDLTNCEGRAVNNHLICSSCGAEIDEGDEHNYGDDVYCDDCFYDNFWTCERCGDVYSNDDDHVSIDGCYYCEECADRKGYRRCESCGEWTNEYFYSDITDEYYCESCYCDKFSHCDICDNYHYREDVNMITVDGDRLAVCDDCKEKLYRCDECGKYFEAEEDALNCCAEEETKEETEEVLTINN